MAVSRSSVLPSTSGAWAILAIVCLCVVATGLATGRVSQLTAPSVAAPPSMPQTAFGACGEPAFIVGSGEAAGGELRAFTNTLVLVPGCEAAGRLLLTGSLARGVGPAVSVTYVGAGGESTGWYGEVDTGGVEVPLPPATRALVSFTNDLASGAEDRNLRLEVAP